MGKPLTWRSAATRRVIDSIVDQKTPGEILNHVVSIVAQSLLIFLGSGLCADRPLPHVSCQANAVATLFVGKHYKTPQTKARRFGRSDTAHYSAGMTHSWRRNLESMNACKWPRSGYRSVTCLSGPADSNQARWTHKHHYGTTYSLFGNLLTTDVQSIMGSMSHSKYTQWCLVMFGNVLVMLGGNSLTVCH